MAGLVASRERQRVSLEIGSAFWRPLTWLRARARSSLASFRARPPLEQTVWGLTVLIVLLGIVLRMRAYVIDPPSLWLDEAAWTNWLLTIPLLKQEIRPIGFMALSRALAQLFGPYEATMRFLPWISGIGSTLLAAPLARRLFNTDAARLLFVAIVALHPIAIDFSSEFKPYSTSLLAHLMLLWLVLRYVKSRSGRDLAWALAAAALGSLFTLDLVFAYPASFLVLAWEARREPRKLAWIAVTAIAILATLGALYVLVWSNLPGEENSQYWGNRYNTFYLSNDNQSYLRWLFERQADIATLPGFRRRFWTGTLAAPRILELRLVDGWIWLILHGLGVLSLLAGRRVREAALLLLPFVVFWIFNRIGYWPGGAFRTNVFLIGYTAAIACMAVDQRRAKSTRWTALIPALLLVILPLVLFDRQWNARKAAHTQDSRFEEALELVLKQAHKVEHGRRTKLLLDGASCSPFGYYSVVHPGTAARLGPKIRKTFKSVCVRGDPKLIDAVASFNGAPPSTIWALVNNDGPLARFEAKGSSVKPIFWRGVGQHTVVGFRRVADPKSPKQ